MNSKGIVSVSSRSDAKWFSSFSNVLLQICLKTSPEQRQVLRATSGDMERRRVLVWK